MRTVTSPRRIPELLLALVLLAGAPAGAQDGPLGPSPDEEQKLRLCPQLKDATGRRREQLEALYFELSPSALDEPRAARARELFDLAREDDVALLRAELAAEGDKGGPAASLAGLQAVLRAHGARGLAWLVAHLITTPREKSARVIAALAAFDEREAWSALLALLADPTPVPNARAAAVAPPGYVHLRVCDHALRALAPRLRATFPPPEGVEWRVEPLLPVKLRDQRLAALRALAAIDAFQAHLAARASARDALPEAERASFDEALAKLSSRD